MDMPEVANPGAFRIQFVLLIGYGCIWTIKKHQPDFGGMTAEDGELDAFFNNVCTVGHRDRDAWVYVVTRSHGSQGEGDLNVYLIRWPKVPNKRLRFGLGERRRRCLRRSSSPLPVTTRDIAAPARRAPLVPATAGATTRSPITPAVASTAVLTPPETVSQNPGCAALSFRHFPNEYGFEDRGGHRG